MVMAARQKLKRELFSKMAKILQNDRKYNVRYNATRGVTSHDMYDISQRVVIRVPRQMR